MRADTSPSAERAMHCVCCVSYIVPLFLRLLCKLPNFAEKCTEREGLSSICSLQSLPSLTEMFDSFPCLMLTLDLSYSICCYTVTVAKGGTRVTCEEVRIGGNPWQLWFWELEMVWALLCCLWSGRRHLRRFPVFYLKDGAVILSLLTLCHCTVSVLSLSWQEGKLKLSYSKV